MKEKRSVGVKGKGPPQWWMLPVLLIASVAATGSDLRLVEAVKKRNQEAVRALLKQNADVNAREADGGTALHWAAHWDDLETAQRLIRADANVNAANDYGVTPLSLACINRSAAMVANLLKAGADLNVALLSSGETVLMTCARTGNVDAVKSLLVHGANVNAKENRKGQTALMWAIAGRHPEVARVLIEHGADIHATSKSGFTPLLFAAQQGDFETVRILLAAGVNLNEATPEYGSALVVASANGHEALSIFLLDRGADPNAADAVGITGLHASVQKGKLELVKALLAHGANPNLRLLKEPPRLPGELGNFGNLKLIGATPFLLAAKATNASIMRILAAGGADPLLATTDSTTPLMVAAGIGWNFNTGFGVEGSNSAVLEAIRAAALGAVKVAVELGADVNAANQSGLTALHGTAASGADGAIQFLVDRGAKVDVKDKLGRTPLFIAERVDLSIRVFAQDSTADLLLKLGATPLTDPAARRSHAVFATPHQ